MVQFGGKHGNFCFKVGQKVKLVEPTGVGSSVIRASAGGKEIAPKVDDQTEAHIKEFDLVEESARIAWLGIPKGKTETQKMYGWIRLKNLKKMGKRKKPKKKAKRATLRPREPEGPPPSRVEARVAHPRDGR
jgi:hypothetical protein